MVSVFLRNKRNVFALFGGLIFAAAIIGIAASAGSRLVTPQDNRGGSTNPTTPCATTATGATGSPTTVIASSSASTPLGPSPPTSRDIFVFYKTKFTTGQTYAYYNPDNKGWIPQPGSPMTTPDASTKYDNTWRFYAFPASSAQLVFNNGGGSWDNNNGKNYQLTQSGVWEVQNGVLTFVSVTPPSCPGGDANPCNGNGQCDANTKVCTCTASFYGFDCGKKCNDCGSHGQCNDGASGDGSCKCQAGWSSCIGCEVLPGNAAPCSVNLQSDSKNCGQCGSTCLVESGDSSASCSSGVCNRVCKSGYILCSDNSCYQGTECAKPPLPGCDTFHNNVCTGSVIETDPSFEASRWQTPARGSSKWQAGYQDHSRLVGHVRQVYSPDRLSCTVTVVTILKDPTVSLRYAFNGVGQSDASKVFTSVTQNSFVSIVVTGTDGSRLELDDVDFIWNTHLPINHPGDIRNGQKGAIAEMFGWKHADIGKECEMLGKAGYLGTKFFPVHEQLASTQPYQNEINPWYFMYQPVSYRLQGRGGTRDQLRSAIAACRTYGVRSYADAVVNHMTGSGNDHIDHRNGQAGCTTWGNKTTSADFNGNGKPSFAATQGFTFEYNENTQQAPTQEFPGVPYGPLDFHCERALSSWTDPLILNAGWLVGLTDLNTERENVQQRIADYMTDLISIGFAGFRVDAAKHIHPADMAKIMSKFKANLGGSLTPDFISWLEVLVGGEKDLLMCNPGYSYSEQFLDLLKAEGLTDTEADQVKIWFAGYPGDLGSDCGKISRVRETIQNDDHDQQNPGSSSRDMHDSGSVLVKDKDINKHRGFEVKLFDAPFGVSDNANDWPIRTVLSSYWFPDSGIMGPPDGHSSCSLCREPTSTSNFCASCQGRDYIPAHNPDACSYEGTDYTRVHRDLAIIKAMRRWIGLSDAVSAVDVGLPARCGNPALSAKYLRSTPVDGVIDA
jgi:alpha-amylase